MPETEESSHHPFAEASSAKSRPQFHLTCCEDNLVDLCCCCNSLVNHVRHGLALQYGGLSLGLHESLFKFAQLPGCVNTGGRRALPLHQGRLTVDS